MAVLGGDLYAVRFLVSRGVDVNFGDASVTSPNQKYQGIQPEILRVLYKDTWFRGWRNTHKIDQGNWVGDTTLVIAPSMENKSAVRILLRHEADLCLTIKKRETALREANNFLTDKTRPNGPRYYLQLRQSMIALPTFVQCYSALTF